MDLLKGFFEFVGPILDKAPVLRAVIGVLWVFFVPGFAWTFVFFKKLHSLERIVFAFALSAALVTLSIVFTNVVFHTKITGLNSLLTIFVITIIPVAVYYGGKLLNKRAARE